MRNYQLLKGGYGMFSKSHKNKMFKEDVTIYAPMDGEIIDLTQVPEEIFAKKLMGEGYAIEPEVRGTKATIYSPASGEITICQGHAVGLRRADGLELFLHIGIDTVSLNGEPFDISLKIGDFVQGGEKIGSVRWHKIQEANLPLTTTVLITNTSSALENLQVNYGSSKSGKAIGEAIAKKK